MPRQIKTRDYNLLLIIGGATKAGIHRDARKHASATACRGQNKMLAQKKKSFRAFDWTRPALHGDELCEIHVDETEDIVAAYLIDEDGREIPFNLTSFNEDEIASIREAANV